MLVDMTTLSASEDRKGNDWLPGELKTLNNSIGGQIENDHFVLQAKG